ncbi:hypothetical protein EVAR_25590_1 [Eumeta japonica]|uniref:Uncharacterized protein n=1 Tax=Eumeta variegata TaxID=151549 RepID=A0A4C1V1Z0_EUMVA|nr:hypothetical protein EVAR_25590_1 [Eumeta japonica]
MYVNLTIPRATRYETSRNPRGECGESSDSGSITKCAGSPRTALIGRRRRRGSIKRSQKRNRLFSLSPGPVAAARPEHFHRHECLIAAPPLRARRYPRADCAPRAPGALRSRRGLSALGLCGAASRRRRVARYLGFECYTISDITSSLFSPLFIAFVGEVLFLKNLPAFPVTVPQLCLTSRQLARQPSNRERHNGAAYAISGHCVASPAFGAPHWRHSTTCALTCVLITR